MADFDFLRKFYEKHYQAVDTKADTLEKKACQDAIKDWEKHRKKIINNELKLTDYVDDIDNSPIKFLTYRAKSFVPLGSMRPNTWMIRVDNKKETGSKDNSNEKLSAKEKAVKLKEANYIVSKKYTKDGKEKYDVKPEDAEKLFKEKILPLLRLIIGVFTTGIELDNDLLCGSLKAALSEDLKAILGDKFSEIVEDALKMKSFDIVLDKISRAVGKIEDETKAKITELLDRYKQFDSNPVGIDALDWIQKTKLYRDFSGGQLLLKIMIIESASDTCCEKLQHRLPIMTKKETIDKLYNDFFDYPENADELTTVRKAYNIMEKCYKELSITVPALNDQIAISTMLWDYAEVNLLDVTEDSPNVIYYGSPGTGKTYAVNKGIDIVMKGEENGRVARVQCHPGFGYEEFIEGLKPVGLTEQGTIKLEIVNGMFKDLCIKAKNDLDQDYYFVADEINRANLSAMFGETLSLLETDYRDYRDGKRNTISTPMSELIKAYIKSNIIPKDGTAEKNDAIINKIKQIAYECVLVYAGDEKHSLNEEILPNDKPIIRVEYKSTDAPLSEAEAAYINSILIPKDGTAEKNDAIINKIKQIAYECVLVYAGDEKHGLNEEKLPNDKPIIRVEYESTDAPLSEAVAAYINSKFIPKDETAEKNDAIINKIKQIAYECVLVYAGDEKHGLNEEKLPNDKPIISVEDVSFGVPKNIRFIGMMNDVDKSIDAFDLALRRRFKWIRKDCNYDALERALVNDGVDDDSVSQYRTACEKLNNFISKNDNGGLGFGKPYEFGHAYFMKIITYLKRDKTISDDDRKLLFNEHLLPVLTEYIRSFKDESEIEKYIKEARKIFTAKDEAEQSTTDNSGDAGSLDGDSDIETE